MGFDLSKIETKKRSEEGVDFPIKNAAGEIVYDSDGPDKKPLTIKLGGGDSPRIKNLVKDRTKRKQEEVQKRLEAGTPEPDWTWEDQEREVIEDLVCITFGWSDSVELDGKPLPFSAANAAILYDRFPEIAQDMTRTASSRVRFMPTSSKS